MTPSPLRPAAAPQAILAPEYEKNLTRQEYGSKPRIEGVVVKDLRRFTEEAGDFQELARFTEEGHHEDFPSFRVRQMNYSVMEPGAVKAFHLHKTQEDLWFVPPQSKLLVGLIDCRAESPTRGVPMRLTLGDGKSQVLYIPRGVAHGAANLTPRHAVIVYLVNQQFSAEEPDEHRLPPHLLGTDFWSIPPG